MSDVAERMALYHAVVKALVPDHDIRDDDPKIAVEVALSRLAGYANAACGRYKDMGSFHQPQYYEMMKDARRAGMRAEELRKEIGIMG